MKAELLLDARAELGEGPLWDHRDGSLRWVDIMRGLVHRTDLDGASGAVESIGEPVGCVALYDAGGLVAGTATGFRRVDGAAGHPVLARVDHGVAGVRMNDGKADPAGRFVAGSMALDQRPGAGALWSYEGGRARRIVDHATISNGLAWSADATTMYYVDTPTRCIDAFDYDLAGGTVTGRRTVVEIPASAGDPDGLTIDAEDGLWVALWGGAAVHRYAEGRLDAVVELPTPLVTCPAFAGELLDLLVVTTATIDLDEPGPGDGGLYVARVGGRGRPEPVVRA
jgi:sugar lactone lactonase YvrE